MFYRDFMQKFRPLYAPDGVDGVAPAAPVGGDAAPAAAAAAAPDAAPAAGTAEAGAAAVPDAASAAGEQKQESAPSLLEAAASKPKPNAAGDVPAADGTAKKEEPAPADAAKPDASKDADAAGDKKPDAEADKAKDKTADATDPAKDVTAEAQPPAPIKYEAFKLPDGIKLADKELGKFTDIVGAAQVPQDVAQSLVDLYIEDRGQLVQELRAEQRKTWDTLNDTWKTETRNDPDLGGNRLETSLSMAKAVIEEYGGSAEQVRELLAHTSNNGMGNFPGFIRLLNNLAVKLNVFEDSMVPANPQAPKMQKSPGNRGWYDKSPGNGAASS